MAARIKKITAIVFASRLSRRPIKTGVGVIGKKSKRPKFDKKKKKEKKGLILLYSNLSDYLVKRLNRYCLYTIRKIHFKK